MALKKATTKTHHTQETIKPDHSLAFQYSTSYLFIILRNNGLHRTIPMSANPLA